MAFVSLAIIFGTLFICDLLRSYINTQSNHLVKNLILDAILAVELCATALELGVIFEYYGLVVWTVGLFLNAVYQSTRWRGLSGPSPYIHMLEWISGKQSVGIMALRSMVLLSSGVATYRFFITTLWTMEWSEMHVGRHMATSANVCVVPWLDVPTTYSLIAETVGSFALGIGPRLVIDNPTLSNNDPLYSAVLIASMVCVSVLAAMGWSGGMFNPMLASVLVGGCKGHDVMQHIIIYWVGATVGALLAFLAYPSIKSFVYPVKTKVAKKMQ